MFLTQAEHKVRVRVRVKVRVGVRVRVSQEAEHKVTDDDARLRVRDSRHRLEFK